MDESNPYSSPESAGHHDWRTGKWRFAILQYTASFFLSIIGGALIWAMSSEITGEVEPWDALWPYYFNSVFAVTMIAALVSRWQFWIPIVGVYIGQNVYCFFEYNPGGPIIFPTFLATAIFGLVPSVVGAACGLLPRICWFVIANGMLADRIER